MGAPPWLDMNMEDWLLEYGGAAGPQDELEGIQKFRALMEGKKVYLWGAGSVVRLYIDLFKKAGITAAGLIDKQSHGGTVEGCEVLPPSALLSTAAVFMMGFCIPAFIILPASRAGSWRPTLTNASIFMIIESATLKV